MLDNNEKDLHDGFSFAYKTVLEMIRDNDHRGLTGIVEPTLRKDLTEELAELVYEDVELKLENEDHYDTRIDILDFWYHFGADINREHNHNLRLKKLEIPIR